MDRALLLKALVAPLCGLGVVVAACGGDDASETVNSAATIAAGGGTTSTPGASVTPSRTGIVAATPSAVSTAGTEGGPEPLLDGPASQFVFGELDLGGYLAMAPEVTTLDLSGFITASRLFINSKQGEDLSKEWGFKEGFKTAFEPDGQLAALLQGRFYINVEVYLFATTEGASRAYAHIESLYRNTAGSERQQAKGLGNQSSGWKFLSGKVGTSDVDAVYHRFIFRRGNLVAAVQTLGAAPTMTVDQARDLAVFIDDLALGKRPTATPTPISKPGLPPTPAPSPAGR